jgi:hypothetical protein
LAGVSIGADTLDQTTLEKQSVPVVLSLPN